MPSTFQALSAEALCRPVLPRAARVLRVEVENYRTHTFTLDATLPEARPGQFLMVWLPGIHEKPLSLLSADPVRLTVAAVGPFTRAMHRLQPGDPVWWRGPFGNGFDLRGEHVLLVAGGYGVAPLHFLAGVALAQGRRVTVIVGARTRQELLFEARFRALGVGLVLTTDDGSYGREGQVTDALQELLDEDEVDEVYACGPEPMLEAVKDICVAQGVPVQLSWDRVMRCAMGICGTCEREGWLVCRDGPVERIAPLERTNGRVET